MSDPEASLPAGTTSYVDYLAAHNVGFNYFYLVRGIACSTGQPMDSNRAGEFDFPLVNENAPWTPIYRLHGLNYSPYIGAGENPNWGGDQITDEELADRLAVIAPYTEWIRTFGCNNDLREAGKFAAHRRAQSGCRRLAGAGGLHHRDNRRTGVRSTASSNWSRSARSIWPLSAVRCCTAETCLQTS